MTRCLVVGLLPGQAARVRAALGKTYRFRFLTSEQASRVGATSDVNVILLDYVTHPMVWRLEKLLRPGQALLRVRGLDKNVITSLGNICRPSI